MTLMAFCILLEPGRFNPEMYQIVQNMWAVSGDYISKLYAGTKSSMTYVTTKGKENMFAVLSHGVTGFKRFLQHNLSDEMKQQSIDILSGLGPTSVADLKVETDLPFAQKEEIIEVSRVSIHVSTLNCAGRFPDHWQDLMPVFKKEGEPLP